MVDVQYERLNDTKEVIRSRILKMNRWYNGWTDGTMAEQMIQWLNRRYNGWTDDTMAKRKRNRRQTMGNEILHRTL